MMNECCDVMIMNDVMHEFESQAGHSLRRRRDKAMRVMQERESERKE